MNLPPWKRPLVVVTAIAAIVIANCYAPRLAHAARHSVTAAEVVSIHHQDHTASMHGHEHDQADRNKTAGDPNPYCCAAACTTIAFIFETAILDVPPVVEPASAAAVEALRKVFSSAIDPPPRIV